MAVRTQEELMNQFNEIIGEENTNDNVLAFMTDMRDTLSDSGSETVATLRREKDELDKSWRKKYRDAFMGKKDDIPNDDEDDKPKSRKYEDLFK